MNSEEIEPIELLDATKWYPDMSGYYLIDLEYGRGFLLIYKNRSVEEYTIVASFEIPNRKDGVFLFLRKYSVPFNRTTAMNEMLSECRNSIFVSLELLTPPSIKTSHRKLTAAAKKEIDRILRQSSEDHLRDSL